MNFIEYAAKHGFALFPCRAGTKVPIVKWTQDSSRDPVQWQEWREAGNNLAINAAQSGLIILDIDSSKIGRDAAWQAWCDLTMREWGLPTPPEVQCQSARGGWHCYVRRPDGVDPASLSGTKILVRDEQGNELIGVKVRGYAVAPGSSFESHPYAQLSDAPPHECPPGLLQALQLPIISAPSGVAGESDPVDVAALVAFLDAEGEFSTEPDWFRALGAIKLALGDTDDGISVANQITFEEVTDAEFRGKWDRLSNEPRPRDYTIASMIWRAEQLGRKFHVRRSSKAMFDSVAAGAIVTTPTNSLVSREPGAAIPISEDDIALSFADIHGAGIRYVDEWSKWLEWRDGVWHLDKTIGVFDLIRRHVRSYAGALTNQDARKLTNAKTIAAVEKLAKSDRRVAATSEIWDADDWLLNTPGGVVDLRTGVMRPANPGDHMTKMTAAAPGGDCPQWKAFLRRSLGGDADLISFVQRVLGYTLTGSTQEEALFFAHGNGGNGKGVLMKTVAKILGDYAKNATMTTFAQTKYEQHTTDIARLRGARLVTASETESGQEWAESKIKTLTGGDTVTARFMRADNFEFDPKFKLLIAGNHKPRLKNVDQAIRRRFYLIPFTIDIPKEERNERLKENLQAEWPGILAWMIEGCLAWQRDGLNAPKSVLAATNEYFESEDALLAWLAERCDKGPNLDQKAEVLFGSWSGWARFAGETIGTKKEFYAAMRRHGFEAKKHNDGLHFAGVKERPLPQPGRPPAAQMFADVVRPSP